jgi:hypothetical protein
VLAFLAFCLLPLHELLPLSHLEGKRHTPAGARPPARGSTTTGRASTSSWPQGPQWSPRRPSTASSRLRTFGWRRRGRTTRPPGPSCPPTRRWQWALWRRRSARGTSSRVRARNFLFHAGSVDFTDVLYFIVLVLSGVLLPLLIRVSFLCL